MATSTNITFADGSMLLVGDNTAGTASDNAANDADGTGGASSAVLFATLSGAPNMGAADFMIAG